MFPEENDRYVIYTNMKCLLALWAERGGGEGVLRGRAHVLNGWLISFNNNDINFLP